MSRHTLQHALDGCGCPASSILRCVWCTRELRAAADRIHVDTCGERCYRALVAEQRKPREPRVVRAFASGRRMVPR